MLFQVIGQPLAVHWRNWSFRLLSVHISIFTKDATWPYATLGRIIYHPHWRSFWRMTGWWCQIIWEEAIWYYHFLYAGDFYLLCRRDRLRMIDSMMLRVWYLFSLKYEWFLLLLICLRIIRGIPSESPSVHQINFPAFNFHTCNSSSWSKFRLFVSLLS